MRQTLKQHLTIQSLQIGPENNPPKRQHWTNFASRKVQGQKSDLRWSSIFFESVRPFWKGGRWYLSHWWSRWGVVSPDNCPINTLYTPTTTFTRYTLYFKLYTFHFTPIQSIHFTPQRRTSWRRGEFLMTLHTIFSYPTSFTQWTRNPYGKEKVQDGSVLEIQISSLQIDFHSNIVAVILIPMERNEEVSITHH